MTIENKGYESFNTASSNFCVEVSEYSYNARLSQLDTLELPDGGKIQGKLTFQVPPQAALPKTGYTLAYSGKAYNIRWVNLPATPTNVSGLQASNPVVEIAYSTSLMWLSAPGTQYLKVKPPGNLYLVVEMTIINRGYESFNTNPDNFTVAVSSPIQSFTAAAEEELIDWRELNIPNSGKYTGSLVFQVPTEIAQSFYKWEYKMIYIGIRSHNVQWIKINVITCTIDAEETELEGINLSDGKSTDGRLAFNIPPELASAGASYEMQFDRSTPHNVQWFDRPDAAADVNRNPISYPVIKITYSTSLMRKEDTGRLYLIVNLSIENKGYESFNISPGHFFVEIKVFAEQADSQ